MAVQLQLLLDDAERVVTQEHVDGSVRANDQKPCRFSPPSKRRYEVEGRIIAPVQIFEPDNERVLSSQYCQRLGQFPQHPVPRRAGKLLLKLGALLRLGERGQLHKPHRGELP